MTSMIQESSLLKSKVCLVIGGGSLGPGWGIGRAIAFAFAREGACVAVADVNLEAAQETVDLIIKAGGKAASYVVDVTDDASIQGLVSDVEKQLGPIDVLYNNVGISKRGDAAETSGADWRRIQDANVTSIHIAAQAVLPGMKARKSGVILTTSSVAAQRHLGYSSVAYAATKAAAIHLTQTIAIEYAAYGIRANSIVAGLIDTPRIKILLKDSYGGSIEDMQASRNRVVPMGHMGDAWDIAEAAVFLASDKAKYITGTQLVVDGGLSATVPH